MVVPNVGHEGLERKYMKSGWDVYGWNRNGIFYDDKIWYQADLMIPSETQTVIKRIAPDLILHCAGSADVNKSVQYPLLDLQKNYITTENILFAMKQCDLTGCRFILFSSAAVYGNPICLPMDEYQPVNPLSPYALHKRAAEEICEFMNKNYGIDTKILRIFSVYGPHLKKQIFWDMYQKVKVAGELKLFGSGLESRDYIYIDDLVNAVKIVADKAAVSDLYFNVGNGEEITIRKAAEVFAKRVKLDKDKIVFMGNRREGDPVNWCSDISKLKQLGYRRSVSFSQGINHYVDWLEKA